jgi:hypothetical protein
MAARYERVRTRPAVVAASTSVTKDDVLDHELPAAPLKGKIGG